MARSLVAVVATIFVVLVPLALFKPDNSTAIHWDRLALVIGGAFAVSWTMCQILARKSRNHAVGKSFD